MKLLPHERRRFAGKLRFLRDRLKDAIEHECRHPEITLNESWVDELCEAETQAALTWAIEQLEDA